MIGERIKERRLFFKLSQAALAEKIGVKQQSVGQWEKEETFPDEINLNKAAEILQCTPDYLKGYVDDIDHVLIKPTNSSDWTPTSIPIQDALHLAQAMGRVTRLSTSTKENEAPVSKLSPDEIVLIDKYRKMSDRDKDTMLKVAESIVPYKFTPLPCDVVAASRTDDKSSDISQENLSEIEIAKQKYRQEFKK